MRGALKTKARVSRFYGIIGKIRGCKGFDGGVEAG